MKTVKTALKTEAFILVVTDIIRAALGNPEERLDTADWNTPLVLGVISSNQEWARLLPNGSGEVKFGDGTLLDSNQNDAYDRIIETCLEVCQHCSPRTMTPCEVIIETSDGVKFGLSNRFDRLIITRHTKG